MFLLHLVYLTSSNICVFTIDIDRETNYFETLGFKSNEHVSQEEIEHHYQTLNSKYNPAFNPDPANIVKFKKIHEAYECLKGFQCRIQYKKFGSYIQSLSSNNNQQDSQKDPLTNLDIRMASSLAFYFTFAILASAMSTTEVTLLKRF